MLRSCEEIEGAEASRFVSLSPRAGRRCREAAYKGRHPAVFAPHPAFGHPLSVLTGDIEDTNWGHRGHLMATCNRRVEDALEESDECT